MISSVCVDGGGVGNGKQERGGRTDRNKTGRCLRKDVWGKGSDMKTRQEMG